jgi:hypothetical protein
MSRWEVSGQVREDFTPIVSAFIEKVNKTENEDELDLSDTKLNPYTLKKLLEELGYIDDGNMDTNGWQLDYWIPMSKEGSRSLSINGTGITFELKLVATVE